MPKTQITIANDEAKFFSELKKEDGYFLYTEKALRFHKEIKKCLIESMKNYK